MALANPTPDDLAYLRKFATGAQAAEPPPAPIVVGSHGGPNPSRDEALHSAMLHPERLVPDPQAGPSPGPASAQVSGVAAPKPQYSDTFGMSQQTGAGGPGGPPGPARQVNAQPYFDAVQAQKEANLAAANAKNAYERQTAKDMTDAVSGPMGDRDVENAGWQEQFNLMMKKSAEHEARRDAIFGQKVDPEQYWNSRDEFQKASGVLGLAMGGWLQGAGKQSPAAEMLSKSIERDVNAQHSNIERGIRGYEQEGSELERNFAHFGDMHKAKLATIVDRIEDMKTLANLHAQTVGSDEARLEAEKVNAGLDEQAAKFALGLGVKYSSGKRPGQLTGTQRLGEAGAGPGTEDSSRPTPEDIAYGNVPGATAHEAPGTPPRTPTTYREAMAHGMPGGGGGGFSGADLAGLDPATRQALTQAARQSLGEAEPPAPAAPNPRARLGSPDAKRLLAPSPPGQVAAAPPPSPNAALAAPGATSEKQQQAIVSMAYNRPLNWGGEGKTPMAQSSHEQQAVDKATVKRFDDTHRLITVGEDAKELRGDLEHIDTVEHIGHRVLQLMAQPDKLVNPLSPEYGEWRDLILDLKQKSQTTDPGGGGARGGVGLLRMLAANVDPLDLVGADHPGKALAERAFGPKLMGSMKGAIQGILGHAANSRAEIMRPESTLVVAQNPKDGRWYTTEQHADALSRFGATPKAPRGPSPGEAAR